MRSRLKEGQHSNADCDQDQRLNLGVPSAAMTKAAIYARISLDRHDGEGVERQLADSRALVAERGWTAVEYVDNDISAYRKRERPAWLELVRDLNAGRVDAVVAYHPDRLYRRLVDLETLIGAIEAGGVLVATVKAGDIDLSTATGRMTARIIAAVAAGESERIGERVSRAKRERAVQGRPSGGGARPFGLTADRLALVPDEAAQIRLCAEAVAAGKSIGSQVRRLNAEGHTTPRGYPWSTTALRRVLTHPYVAGLRAYRGEIVGEAVTPAIIERRAWEELRSGQLARSKGRPPSAGDLLTGLLRCGACGGRMYGANAAGGRVYQCRPNRDTGPSCARSITAGPIEAHVKGIVGGWLRHPDLAAEIAAVSQGASDSGAELDDIEQRIRSNTRRYSLSEISEEEYEDARAILMARKAKLAPVRTRPVVSAAELAAIRAMWDDDHADPDHMRAAIEAFVKTPLTVGPGRAGRMIPASERVAVEKRWPG